MACSPAASAARTSSMRRGEKGVVTVPNPTAQLEVGTLQTFLDKYLEENGGKIDYIHGDDTARSLGEKPNCAAVLLPPVEKNGLFLSVLKNGALPKKSFSMGNARDKRYYLECRKIL